MTTWGIQAKIELIRIMQYDQYMVLIFEKTTREIGYY